MYSPRRQSMLHGFPRKLEHFFNCPCPFLACMRFGSNFSVFWLTCVPAPSVPVQKYYSRCKVCSTQRLGFELNSYFYIKFEGKYLDRCYKTSKFCRYASSELLCLTLSTTISKYNIVSALNDKFEYCQLLKPSLTWNLKNQSFS